MDVLKASSAIDDEKPAIVNYCDFYMSWEWKRFKKALAERDPDGCVPCYTGFHPHLMVGYRKRVLLRKCYILI